MGYTTAESDRLAALAGELARMGRALDSIGAELMTIRGEAAQAPAQPQWAPPQAVQPQAVQPQAPHTHAPHPQPVHPPTAQPQTAAPPVEPARTRRSLGAALASVGGAKLLAWTGGAVTLLGVALLLGLAAARGWFAPPVRIAAGAVLGLGLVALGMWLYRTVAARTGAVAVAATGFATTYLVVAAAGALYHYLDAVPALVLALVVAVGGLGLADRWRSAWLAYGVAVGALVLAPVVARDWLVPALGLVMAVTALPVVLRRAWPWLGLIVGVLTSLYAAGVGTTLEPVGATTLALAVLLVGSGAAAVTALRLGSGRAAAGVPVSAVPLLVTAIDLQGWRGGALALGAAVVLGAVAVFGRSNPVLRTVAATSAAVALLVATAVALDGASFTLVLLGQALASAVLAWALRDRLAFVIAAVFGAIGTVVALARDLPLEALVQRPNAFDSSLLTPQTLVTGAAVGALVLAVAVAAIAAAGRLGWARPDSRSALLWVPLGLVGLYGATGLVVELALLVAPSPSGFTAGHAVVTVSWTVAALVLLAQGISRPALRVAGMVLVAAAVAKLVLFDLVALDGIARVAAFIGAGLVLLAAGTRYARKVAQTEQTRADQA